MSTTITFEDDFRTGDIPDPLRARFYDAKERARGRMGVDELTHGRFLSILLDAYELHEPDREVNP